MNKLIACVLAATCIGMSAMAGPVVGVTLIPSGSVAYPYLAAGWDAGYMLTTLEIGNPMYIDGWYGLRVQPLRNVSTNIRVGGNIGLFGCVHGFQVSSAVCFVGVSCVANWNGIMLDVSANLPYVIQPDAPLGGAWGMGGMKFSW